MRDYVLHQARFREGTFAFPRLRRLIHNWRVRRHLRQLETFDDYLLADIGLTRADLRYGQGLPWDVDPMAELTRVRGRRMVRHR